jgi:hypothetical protein
MMNDGTTAKHAIEKEEERLAAQTSGIIMTRRNRWEKTWRRMVGLQSAGRRHHLHPLP